MDRRDFLGQITKGAVSSAMACSALGVLAWQVRRNPAPHRLATEPGTLRPPGALPEDDFLASCIRCTACHDSCMSRAIQLAGPGDPAETGTPFILPTETACNLCLACTTACPTGALQPITDIKTVAMGTAVIDPRTCVAINQTGVCGACHTVCPLRNSAITLGLHNAPVVHEEHCVGCGLCEEACIVRGTKAIRVFPERERA
ncbi:MAG: 4Fe-4S dicluster domain-containing protein [Gemmatimonadetes bacterium]|nr:4Fe-4S dicluster domain-containing protein [Gemmatimonadota bacterium]